MKRYIIFSKRTGSYMGDEHGNIRTYTLRGARGLITKFGNDDLEIYELHSHLLFKSPSYRIEEPKFKRIK